MVWSVVLENADQISGDLFTKTEIWNFECKI